MKDKTTIAIRKSVDDICDVCTCGGDQDDKCPDIIPGNATCQLIEQDALPSLCHYCHYCNIIITT